MLLKTDFQSLPSYKASYSDGDQVFCIPTWSEGNDPLYGVVCDPMPNDRDHVKVWTAQGESEVDVAFCRPGTAEVVLAWLKLLKSDSDLQAPQYLATTYEVQEVVA